MSYIGRRAPNAKPDPVLGARFGRLMVVGATERRGDFRHVPCVCDCGADCPPRLAALAAGGVLSCGCLQREKARALAQVRRDARAAKPAPPAARRRRAPEIQAWRGMLNRCYRTKTRNYHRYGGRGIAVCERWRNSFEAFVADMGRRPSPLHSLDRINNDGNYEPGNVRWATMQQQQRNRSTGRIVEIDGERLSIVEWSERSGVRADRIKLRLNRGWSQKAAVFEPAPKVWSHKRGARVG